MKQALYVSGLIVVLLVALWGFSFIGDKENTNQTDNYSYSEEDAQGAPENNQETMDENNSQPEAQGGAVGETTEVVLKTNKGDVTLELYTGLMPITTGNFIKLARENFYDGVKFHRVIDGFMIQGGDPLTKDDAQKTLWGTGGPGYAIDDEHISHELLSNVRGTISMANAGPNSGGSQFFINVVDNTGLDFDKQPLSSKHPVFGRVVGGMDVVDAIAGVEVDSRDAPLEAVVIEDVVVEG